MSRPAWSPPEGIDWTRPALHIARECGVGIHTVLAWMRKNGVPVGNQGKRAATKKIVKPPAIRQRPYGKGRPWQAPEGTDSARPALHIAKECGVCVHTVISWQRRNGLPVRPRGVPMGQRWKQQNRRKGSLDASILDWRYQDIHLATRHGLCRERIRQLRKAAGLPASGSAAWLAAGGVVTNPLHQGRKSKLALDRPPGPA